MKKDKNTKNIGAVLHFKDEKLKVTFKDKEDLYSFIDEMLRSYSGFGEVDKKMYVNFQQLLYVTLDEEV